VFVWCFEQIIQFIVVNYLKLLCVLEIQEFLTRKLHVWVLKELYTKLPALYKESKLTKRTKPEVEKTKNQKTFKS